MASTDELRLNPMIDITHIYYNNTGRDTSGVPIYYSANTFYQGSSSPTITNYGIPLLTGTSDPYVVKFSGLYEFTYQMMAVNNASTTPTFVYPAIKIGDTIVTNMSIPLDTDNCLYGRVNINEVITITSGTSISFGMTVDKTSYIADSWIGMIDMKLLYKK